ncbi:MAG: FapA family protein [Leptospiraceae bacterium]|nr:FapA family protein [Leptospiraceae bacterium]
MIRLKKALLGLDFEDMDRESAGPNFSELIVLADSLQQALEIGAGEFNCDISLLDYEILEKGSPGLMGLGRMPYRVKVTIMEEDKRFADIEDLNTSLDGSSSGSSSSESEAANVNGKGIVRVYKTGVFVKVLPSKGSGRSVTVNDMIDRIKKMGIPKFDDSVLKKAVKESTGEPVRIGDWVPKPENDSTMSVEISADEMKAYITISAPRPGGRHLQTQDVIGALKKSGLKFGFKDEEIEKALEDDKYGTMILAAEGKPSKYGSDGYIDYKVKIDKKVEFKEDDHGRIDFLSKDLVENVVQGQILAELIPAKHGIEGRTITDRVLPAKDGKPMDLKPGKGTILSEDGKKLLAEKNGQVVFRQGRINIEELLTIPGDVGLDTGNVMFLGSILVRGAVTDNMQVKAAGNIQIGGNIQKAQVEAEGNIIISSGVMGRDGAVLESTTGSVYAKFIQNAKATVDKDVVVAEGILHSNIYAGGKILCNGKRAQIVGGEVMAGEEVRVKQLGAQASTPTTVIVGTNPKVLQQIKQIDQVESTAREKLEKLETNLRTLNFQKNAQKENFSADKDEMLVKMQTFKEKLLERLEDAQQEKEQLNEYLNMLSSRGAVHVEKILFPGVTVEINGARFLAKDEYRHGTLIEENGNIKIVPYQQPKEGKGEDWRKAGARLARQKL